VLGAQAGCPVFRVTKGYGGVPWNVENQSFPPAHRWTGLLWSPLGSGGVCLTNSKERRKQKEGPCRRIEKISKEKQLGLYTNSDRQPVEEKWASAREPARFTDDFLQVGLLRSQPWIPRRLLGLWLTFGLLAADAKLLYGVFNQITCNIHGTIFSFLHLH
jgi:hypothetical protein